MSTINYIERVQEYYRLLTIKQIRNRFVEQQKIEKQKELEKLQNIKEKRQLEFSIAEIKRYEAIRLRRRIVVEKQQGQILDLVT